MSKKCSTYDSFNFNSFFLAANYFVVLLLSNLIIKITLNNVFIIYYEIMIEIMEEVACLVVR